MSIIDSLQKQTHFSPRTWTPPRPGLRPPNNLCVTPPSFPVAKEPNQKAGSPAMMQISTTSLRSHPTGLGLIGLLPKVTTQLLR